MINQTPYSKSTKPSRISTFTVTKTSGSNLTMSGNPSDIELIAEGTLLDLYNFSNQSAGRAVVSRISSSSLQAKTFEKRDDQIRFATVSNWWEAEQPHEEILSEEVFTDDPETCTLEVYCSVSNNHVAGYLGWTLFAQLLDDSDLGVYRQNLIPVAIGNDLKNRGRVFFQHAGKWKPGVYLIRIKRYSFRQLIALQDVDFKWSLTEENLKLSAGSLSDVSLPFNLK